MVRGTILYLGIFVLLRIFRRQAGSLGIADLLLIVVIADAAQNGMAGDAKTVTEAFLLIGTIFFWDYFLDYLGFKSRLFARVLEPDPVRLIVNGRVQRKNLEKEMITEDELLSQLRQQGIDKIEDVRQCFLESNGEFSVIKMNGEPNRSNRKKTGGVN